MYNFSQAKKRGVSPYDIYTLNSIYRKSRIQSYKAIPFWSLPVSTSEMRDLTSNKVLRALSNSSQMSITSGRTPWPFSFNDGW